MNVVGTNVTELKKALKAAGKIKRKAAQDAFLLALGLGLQRGHTRALGTLIVRCAKRLAKADGLGPKELRQIRAAANV